MMQLRASVCQRDARAVPPQIERGNGSGILAADHEHVGVVIRMRLSVVMRNFGKLLAWNAQLIRKIVISSRDDDFFRVIVARSVAVMLKFPSSPNTVLTHSY